MFTRTLICAAALTIVEAQAADPKTLILQPNGIGGGKIYNALTGQESELLASLKGRPVDCPPAAYWTDLSKVENCASGEKYVPKYGSIDLFAKEQMTLEQQPPGTNDPGASKKEDKPEENPP
jgi:hypothetical protein